MVPYVYVLRNAIIGCALCFWRVIFATFFAERKMNCFMMKLYCMTRKVNCSQSELSVASWWLVAVAREPGGGYQGWSPPTFWLGGLVMYFSTTPPTPGVVVCQDVVVGTWGCVVGAPKPSVGTEKLLLSLFSFCFYRRNSLRVKISGLKPMTKLDLVVL